MSPNVILEFILGLLRDHEAAAGYCADPAAALSAAGLAGVTPEDIAAVVPMVAESVLITDGSRLATVMAAFEPAVAEVRESGERSADSTGYPGSGANGRGLAGRANGNDLLTGGVGSNGRRAGAPETPRAVPGGGFAVLDSELAASLRDCITGGVAPGGLGSTFAGIGRVPGMFAGIGPSGDPPARSGENARDPLAASPVVRPHGCAPIGSESADVTGGSESMFGVEVITDLGARADGAIAGIGLGNISAPNGSESSGFGCSTDGSASTGELTVDLDGSGSVRLPGVFHSDPAGFEPRYDPVDPAAELGCPPGHARSAHPGGDGIAQGTDRSGDALDGPDGAGAPSLSDEGRFGGDASGAGAAAWPDSGWDVSEVLSRSDEGGLGHGSPGFAGGPADRRSVRSGSPAVPVCGPADHGMFEGVAGAWSSVDVAQAFGAGMVREFQG